MFYRESVLNGSPEHKNTLFIYVPQAGDTKASEPSAVYNGNYRIRIGFNKTANATDDYTAVDDVHLHYDGKNSFILDDSWTDYENTINTKTSNDNRTNVPIYLKRRFVAGVWNTLVLPVTVSTTQLRAIFGDNVQVATPYGLDDDDPYLIKFTTMPLSGGPAIMAGRFYIVKPEKLGGTQTVMEIDNQNNVNPQTADPGYQFYNLGNHDLADISKGEVGNLSIPTFHDRSLNDKTGHNTINIIGSFKQTIVPKKSYVFGNYNNMYHLTTDMTMGGFRFYITDNDDGKGGQKTAPSKSFTFGSLTDDLDDILASFVNNNSGTTTGINGISKDSGVRNGKYGNDIIYDLSGRIVGIKGKTDKLPSGVYIINGVKFIKR